MYESFYGFSGKPFQLNPDPAFYFGSRQHRRAMAYLEYGLHQNEGFIVVTGEVGAGKTTIVRSLLDKLDPEQVVAGNLVSTQLDAEDTLRLIASSFGLRTKDIEKSDLLLQLEAFLVSVCQQGKRALLIVDEAQNLTPRAVEELRMLSNFQLETHALLQSFLVGQPEFRRTMQSPDMLQLRQRVIAACHVGPMDADETRGYIEHRLKCVGWTGDPHFNPEAYSSIYKSTGGVPRRINAVCDRILLSGYLAGKREFTREDVEMVAREMHDETVDVESVQESEPAPPQSTAKGCAGAPAADRPRATAAGLEIRRRGNAAARQDAGGSHRGAAGADRAPDGYDRHVVAADARGVPAAAHEEASQAMMRDAWLAGTGPVLCVVGARPNFMKMAPILRALAAHDPAMPALLVHTGQHYDADMNDQLFSGLGLPSPDVNLEVGSGTHAVQTAEVMRRFEPVLDAHRPCCVLVVGDVNSTLACTLVAVKKGVPVAHVEAGLRSFDRSMPEEINRVLTDQIADLLYTTERAALDNLVREGVDAARAHFVGNVMIDSLLANRALAIPAAETLQRAGFGPSEFDLTHGYGVVTMHRPANVDQMDTLGPLLAVLSDVSERLPLLLALHPRTRANIERFGLSGELSGRRIAVLPPQGYLEMLGLMSTATMVLTDSGGMQEETTALGVPCLTLRENTERPITIEQGTNMLVGGDRSRIESAVDDILAGGGKRGRVPELWDGRASERIAAHLATWLALRLQPVET